MFDQINKIIVNFELLHFNKKKLSGPLRVLKAVP